MKRQNPLCAKLVDYLKANGPTLSSELVEKFSISRATLSRRLEELSDGIVRIGRARARQLAIRHQATNSPLPIYAVDENGSLERFGELTALHHGERVQWYFAPQSSESALLAGEFSDGLFPGWPWFLEDLRPSGFLGRAFAKRMAKLFQLKTSPDAWTDLELLQTLVTFGSNLSGNFILGEGRALEEHQNHTLEIAEGYYRNISPKTYPQLAQRALEHGEVFGSSAGGEQQKFTTLVCDTPEAEPRAVIVKFSPTINTPGGRRWADLLYAEYIANQILQSAGIKVAQTRIFQLENRVFLESLRFDRMGPLGRRGVVSLRALDAALIGMGEGSWANCARMLLKRNLISQAGCEDMVQIYCFGKLIANTDMHFGNLSFYLSDQLPYHLAPVYDMLPMRFRPSLSGEIVDNKYKPSLPKPGDALAWQKMLPHATEFWETIIQHEAISSDFKAIAKDMLIVLHLLRSQEA